jgi:uncharacterized heparinase superfamily protein
VPVNTAELGRLSRTVVQLRPAQLGQRVRLRAQRTMLDRSVPLAARWLLAGPRPAAGRGWPAGFMPLDSCLWSDSQTAKALRAGELLLIGVPRVLVKTGQAGGVHWAGADWEAADAPLLWRFHLYYWDWAWALAAQAPPSDGPALFTAMWRSWHSATAIGRGQAWHPYPAALRAWSFCGIYRHLVAGGPVEASFRAELAAHAGFLRRNLETDVGGNHLIKNLKALVGLAVFFGDDGMLTSSLRRLDGQLAVQVLPDGGHYERAPAYHCQVLADLIDVAGLLRAAGRGEPTGLAEAIAAMRGWLGAVLTPAGSVPLLNDGFPVSPELLALVAPAAPPASPLRVLPDTGLARITAGWWHVLADIGPPCPGDLPAHAHADTFSCVVHVDRAPLLVDTGTSTYAAGQVRDRERSTAAHNTVEVDHRDSTEVWGAFRAGRRARVAGVSARATARTVTVEAAHDGYRNLPGRPVHRRRWTVDPDELRVDDEVTGRGRHRVTVRWHLAPGTGLRLVPGGAVVTTMAGEIRVTVAASSEPVLKAATAQLAVGLDASVSAPVLVCTLRPELPARISTRWRRPGARQELT